MQKKLIALAIAAAVAAPGAAMAAPTIYGKMHFSADYIDDDNDGDSDDFVTGTSRKSRLGFKGSEALGGDLKAIWQVELGINPQGSSGGTTSTRNTFVGLSGNWGTALLGRHDTPYKIATGKLDLFSDRIGDYNNIMGRTTTSGALFDLRAPQTVAYITPTWGGFHAAAAYIEHKFNEELSAFNDADGNNIPDGGNLFCVEKNPPTNLECSNDDENRAFSIMGMYDNGPFFLSAAYEVHQGANLQFITGQNPINVGPEWIGDDKIYAYKVGGAWRFGKGQIGGAWEQIKDDVISDSPNERWSAMLNGSYAFGKNVIKLQGTYADNSEANCDVNGNIVFGAGSKCDDKAINYSIGLDHNFSKRTTAYAMFSYMDNDDDGTWGLDDGSNNLGDNYDAKRGGDKPRSFSLGMIHKF